MHKKVLKKRICTLILSERKKEIIKNEIIKKQKGYAI